MTVVVQLLILILVLIGTSFSILGVLGLIRLPDVYARLHAAGKVGVFGAALLAAAVALSAPSMASKALILVALLIIAGPVVSHALASAANRLGIPVKHALRDDLAEARKQLSSAQPNQPPDSPC